MLLDPSFRPLGGTRIWTPNSMYRMELKGTIAKILFIPPCPSTFLLTLRQPNQLCARSDLSSCATRKLKIQQNCKTEHTQITMSRVSQKCWFRQIFIFSSKLSGTVNRREKKEEVRKDDKKMKQIRTFLYQLYPIYKIKN